MGVVIVRLEHDVERRQVVELDSRRHPAARTGERDRRGALAPHRVGEDVETRALNEQGGMPDPCDRQRRLGRARHGERWSRALKHGRVRVLRARARAAMHEHPLEQAAEAGDGFGHPGAPKTAARSAGAGGCGAGPAELPATTWIVSVSANAPLVATMRPAPTDFDVTRATCVVSAYVASPRMVVSRFCHATTAAVSC